MTDMPTVAIVGQYQFVIRTREFDFEPPMFTYASVMKTGDGSCWTAANIPMRHLTGTTRAILEAFDAHAAAIRAEWFRIHGR